MLQKFDASRIDRAKELSHKFFRIGIDVNSWLLNKRCSSRIFDQTICQRTDARRSKRRLIVTSIERGVCSIVVRQWQCDKLLHDRRQGKVNKFGFAQHLIGIIAVDSVANSLIFSAFPVQNACSKDIFFVFCRFLPQSERPLSGRYYSIS